MVLIIVAVAWLCCANAYGGISPTHETAPTYENVLVVYNAAYTVDEDQDGTLDSFQVADYFARQRSIPPSNVLAITCSADEVITRGEYEQNIRSPIEAYLTGSGLKNSIRYIVLVKGVPLKIADTGGSSYLTARHSSVDQALCLLYQSYDVTGRYINPYYDCDPAYTMEHRFKGFHYDKLSLYSFSVMWDDINSQAVMYGGYFGDEVHFSNEAHALIPAANGYQWSDIARQGAQAPGMSDHSAVYDPVNERMIVFGGSDVSERKNDTWVLDLSSPEASWRLLQPSGTPPTARYGHQAVYDAANHRMIVFGGNPYETGYHYSNQVFALDLELDSERWYELIPAGTPPPQDLDDYSVIYDPNNERMILYGGHDIFSSELGELKALDLTPGAEAWETLTPSGDVPMTHVEHWAVYDPSRNRMVVFGGRYKTSTGYQDDAVEVWGLSLDTHDGIWQQLSDGSSAPEIDSLQAMVLDSVNDVLLSLIYNDESFTLDLYTYDLKAAGARWIKAAQTGRRPSGIVLNYLVTRLDGYTVADIKGMIDRAGDPAKSGNRYFIFDSKPNSYDSMKMAQLNLAALDPGINVVLDQTTGWITQNPAGPVMAYIGHGVHSGLPDGYIQSQLDFQYANGALFSTYESFNGWGFVSPDQSAHGQVAEFIKMGGTGGIGNVYEPYVSAIPDEDIMLPAYIIGYPLADAVYQSLRYIDWQTVVVGDPLCMIAPDYDGDMIPDAYDNDDDNDGLPDDWEINHDLDPYDDGSYDRQNGFFGDPDSDVAFNYEEFVIGTDPHIADSDADMLADGIELSQTMTHPLDPDTDGDNLSDGWEFFYGFDPLVPNTNQMDDPDLDGLANLYESQNNTSPFIVDSDQDGLLDGDEVNPPDGSFASDPSKPDTDDDGLTDFAERTIGTNPYASDSDGDMLPDQWEVQWGFDPLNFNNSAADDADNDNLSDLEESRHSTNPNLADSDNDGINDAIEIDNGTNPINADSDGDGLSDGVEVSTMTDPLDKDSDGDWMNDGWEVEWGFDPTDNSGIQYQDPDGDWLSNGNESFYGTNPYSDDTDGDGLNDFEEIILIGSSPVLADTDGDQLDDWQEIRVHGTAFDNKDSDDDGQSDYDEIYVTETDPLDKLSKFTITAAFSGATGDTTVVGISWQTLPGRTYRLFYSDDCGENWIPCSGPLDWNGGQRLVEVETASAQIGNRWFRVSISLE